MNKQEIKQYLLDNPQYIGDILENIGCHHIKLINNKRVQCALPYPHDNVTSVQVRLNEYLSAIIHTQNEFEEYEIKDIFTVIQFIKNYTLNESIKLICKICNIQYNNSINKNTTSTAYNFLKYYTRHITKEELIVEEDILPESFIKRFISAECMQYTVDGVNSASQEKFQVSYDVLDNRIVFPIRNEEGQLLSFKGRTCIEDYKINGIPKFISYYPCNNNNYLFGYYENKDAINKADEIFIVEAEKGVMELDSMGINNVVSINKKSISEAQVRKLLKLGKPLVLILDNDVILEQIFIECRKFKGLCDVYYVKDNLDLLGEKDSPIDLGEQIFNKLLIECKFKYKEGKK